MKEIVDNIISFVVHRRYETIKELCNAIAVQNGVYKVNLVEGTGDIVCDNYLIGTIGVVKDNEVVDYDFQVYLYILHRLFLYYKHYVISDEL